MADQPQPTDAPVDDVEGHGRKSPIVLDDRGPDTDDVTGHGRWPGVQPAGPDDTAGRARLHDQDGPTDVEGAVPGGRA